MKKELYTIKKNKNNWIISFTKPCLNRLLKAHPWVYPAFWSHLVVRLEFLGAPHLILDYEQCAEFDKVFGLKPFKFSHNQARITDFVLRGLNSTMCNDLSDHLDALEDFSTKYLVQE